MQRLAGRLGHALADGTSCAWAHDAALASPAGDVGTGPRTADCCRDAGGPGPHAEHLRSHQLADRALARAAEADGGTAATAGAPAAPLAARALEVPYAGVFLRATQAGREEFECGAAARPRPRNLTAWLATPDAAPSARRTCLSVTGAWLVRETLADGPGGLWWRTFLFAPTDYRGSDDQSAPGAGAAGWPADGGADSTATATAIAASLAPATLLVRAALVPEDHTVDDVRNGTLAGL